MGGHRTSLHGGLFFSSIDYPSDRVGLSGCREHCGYDVGIGGGLRSGNIRTIQLPSDERVFGVTRGRFSGCRDGGSVDGKGVVAYRDGSSIGDIGYGCGCDGSVGCVVGCDGCG